jgi:GntR family transcriptional regulator
MGTINKSDGIPLYVKIRQSLHDDIVNKVLLPGQKIPSEDELAAKHGVSRMTVRQSISDLIDEGLLYRRHGVGTFVAHSHVVRDQRRLTNLLEGSEQSEVNLNVQVLIADILPARLRVAQALSLNEGDLVFRVKTLRTTDGVPITVHDAYVPYKIYPQLLQEDLEAHHLWDIFEAHGFRVKRALQQLEAREADEELSNLLQIEIGSPIFYKERTVYLDDGTPVEFTHCYNRGDRYTLTVVLDR